MAVPEKIHFKETVYRHDLRIIVDGSSGEGSRTSAGGAGLHWQQSTGLWRGAMCCQKGQWACWRLLKQPGDRGALAVVERRVKGVGGRQRGTGCRGS